MYVLNILANYNYCNNPPKGYPRFTNGPYRNKYVHRVVWELVAKQKIPEGFHIHHMNGQKTDFRPENLICMEACFNPKRELRCPFTGKFLTVGEWERRYGN